MFVEVTVIVLMFITILALISFAAWIVNSIRVDISELRQCYAVIEVKETPRLLSEAISNTCKKFDSGLCYLDGAKIPCSEIESQKKRFMGAYLRGADFSGRDLKGARFDEAVLRGAKLGCDLWGSAFNDADLRCADLRGADLRYSRFINADMRGVDLRNVDLRCAILERADLRGAIYSEEDLRGAYLFDVIM